MNKRLKRQSLSLRIPPRFDFWRTAHSHGWCDLPPFSFNIETRELWRVLLLPGRATAYCKLTGNNHSVHVDIASTTVLSPNQHASIKNQLQTCLRLDEDFSDFHRNALGYPEYRWIAQSGSGRMLRAPTVFEDAVKMICTTNCTWALTKLMVGNLVQHFGKRFNNALSAFPTPETIAESSETYLRKYIKAGYRSPYLLELAHRVASGELEIETWRSSDLSTEELFKQIRSVKGIGPYAAGNIMKLLGHYDYLGLDSWVRAKYYELHRNGRKVKDQTIDKHYAGYGKWRGLFFGSK